MTATSPRPWHLAGFLDNGKRVAESLVAAVPKDGEMPRLSHIATDGETYGHHHRFGDMRLPTRSTTSR